jgi:tetratricopeptide (TPR) repeat protein
MSTDNPANHPKGAGKGNKGESRRQIGMYLETVMDMIQREDFISALEILNRVIVDAGDAHLGECFSLRGFVNLKLANYQQAEDDCDEAIRRQGNDPETLAWRATARAEQNKWRQAFLDLDLASQVDLNKGKAHLLTMQNWLASAVAALNERIAADPNDPRPLYDRGWVCFLANHHSDAKRDFDELLRRHPSHGGAAIGLARLAFRQADYPIAVRMASLAMQIDPDVLTEALAARAEAYARNGQLSHAIEDVTRLRERAGDDVNGLIHCAVLRERLGDVSGAIGDLEIAGRMNPDLPAVLVARGDAFARIRNYEVALDDYRRYLEIVPGDIAVWLKRADIHVQLGQPELARECYDRALALDDLCAAAYVGRCKVLMDAGNAADALAESERAIRLDSRNPETFLLRGRIYHDQQRYQQAEAEYSRALTMSDDAGVLGEVHFRRGVTRYEAERPHQAIDDFRKAAECRPAHAGTLVWLAATCARLDEWQEVIENLHLAIRVRPSAAQQYRQLGAPVARKAIEHFDSRIREGNRTAEIFAWRGKAHEFLGKHAEAVSDYTAALGNQNDDPEIRIARARLWSRMGDHDKALADLTRVIRSDQSNHPAYYARAAVHLERNDLAPANRDIDRAIELVPTNPRYHVLKGDIHLIAGDTASAINDYSHAVVLDPTDHLAFRKRGSCHQRNGNCLLAIADLTRSLELFPALAETHILRGQVRLKNEQFDLAIADFESALRIDPDQVRAFTGKGNYLACINRHEEALIWLTKAFHRFNNQPRNVSEILMMRGKVFYQMGRFLPAIADFTAVIDLQTDDPFGESAARCARGIALVQTGDLMRAKKEFDRVLKKFPEHPLARSASQWLETGRGARPRALVPPTTFIRPTRPPVITTPHSPEPNLAVESNGKKVADSPLNMWLVRTTKNKEYGPVSRQTLDDWVKQGRIDGASRLLLTGWKTWRKAKRIYPSLGSGKSASSRPAASAAPVAGPVNPGRPETPPRSGN